LVNLTAECEAYSVGLDVLVKVNAVRPRPGAKRVLNAVMGTAAEIDETRRPPFSWKQSLIRSQQRTIGYYKCVLATHQLSQDERNDIFNRIARIEEEPDRLTGPTDNSAND